MTQRSTLLKPAILTVLIVLGLLVEHGSARAADTATAVFAGGCFWCTEADFERVEGVVEAVSGFTGGRVKNPSYGQVVQGDTGHYEAVKITYDPDRVSYDRLLHLFLRSIDPTDAGGQFCDRGPSYRTAVFTADPDERRRAEAALAEAEAALGQEVVTPVLDAGPFYPAEDYHQDYYKKSDLVLTRRGPKTKKAAYRFYRSACGRDARIRALWGSAAPFAG